MRYLTRVLVDLVSLKWILFGTIVYIMGLILKRNIISASLEYKSPFNQWDFLIQFLGDPYLFIYFIFPIWLFFSNIIILKNWNYVLLIRLKGYKKWLLHTLVEISEKLIVIMTIWITAALILTLNIPFEISWSKFSTKITDTNNIIYILSNAEIKPFSGLLIQTLLLILFTIFTHILLATTLIISRKKLFPILFSAILSLGVIVSFKLFFDELKIISLPNYIFLNHSYSSFGSFITAPLTLSLVIFICLFFISIIDRSNLKKKDIWIKKEYLIYSVFCLLGIVSSYLISDTKLTTVWDNLYVRFIGVSEQGFKFSHYIYSCIVFLGFTYLYQLKLSYILTERLYYIIIRYKSIERWFINFIKHIVLSIPILLLLIFFLIVITGLFSGQTLDWKISINESLFVNQVLYHFFINGFFQLFNYLLIIFIVSWISKDVFPSLIAVAIIMLGMFPAINKIQIFPFGLNSLGYVTGNFYDILQITATLIIYNIFELIIILYLFKKRDFLI